ncbi:MAG: hypothetical protein IT249_18875 [Chitinophagaceae bacterium]|nr:hypothetical protein [Chitinophagaceae bacterium]
MKNIENINCFKQTSQHTDFGLLTTLVTETGIAQHGSISFGEKTLLANYIYHNNETYTLVYTIIDKEGNIESFAENEGILPTLFLSPDEENFVSVIPYHPGKELEISIPVFDRENIILPKGNKPFTGKFIGTTNLFSIFFEVDIWANSKPDKLLAIEFNNKAISKKHNIKIDLPRNNKIFISDNEIHLLSGTGKGWLHRQIDENGNMKRQRLLSPNQEHFWEILSLSFEKNAYILCEENGEISIETISEEGKSATSVLVNIKDEFFNVWQPVKISKDSFVTRFNTEFGNGWFTTKQNTLVEIYYSKACKGYKNLLTDKVLELDDEKLVISTINKTTNNGYAVVFYPATERGNKNKKLIILNRQIK